MDPCPVVHFDLQAPDPARVIPFYEAVFGWRFQHLPEMDYWLVTTGEVDEEAMQMVNPGEISGGFSEGPASAEGTVITIRVADIDETLQRVVKAGGQRHQERSSIGEFGWAAGFLDPAGNLVGLFEPPSRG